MLHKACQNTVTLACCVLAGLAKHEELNHAECSFAQAKYVM